MNFDDLLKDAWQGAHPRAPLDLTRRVRSQLRRHRLQRAVEVGLTLVAVLVFTRALISGRVPPSHWLLMPFFGVFLPLVWAIVLRAPRKHALDTTRQATAYARLRLSQLRTGLRDLWLARATAWGLLGYALLANVVTLRMAGPDWQYAGLLLLTFSLVWLGATFWLSRRLRRRWLREYLAVRRLMAG